jgi:hypothetical protein
LVFCGLIFLGGNVDLGRRKECAESEMEQQRTGKYYTLGSFNIIWDKIIDFNLNIAKNYFENIENIWKRQ